MDTRLLLNLGLATLLGALVLLAVYKPGVEQAPAKQAISQSSPDSIAQMRIVRTGQPTVELSKDAQGHWQMKAPLVAPGNNFRLKQVLALLTQRPEHTYPASQLDLSQVGLTQPALRLQLGTQQISFGDQNPLDQLRYILIGDQVHLIKDEQFELLNGPATAFVDSGLLPENARVNQITLPDGKRIGNQGGKLHLTPADDTVSADALQDLITHWKNDRALTVTEYGGSEQIEGTIVIKLEGTSDPLRYDILSTEPELVLGRPDLRLSYHMSEGSLGKLTRVDTQP